MMRTRTTIQDTSEMDPNTPDSASCVVRWSAAAIRNSIALGESNASNVLGRDSRGVVCLDQLTQKNDFRQGLSIGVPSISIDRRRGHACQLRLTLEKQQTTLDDCPHLSGFHGVRISPILEQSAKYVRGWARRINIYPQRRAVVLICVTA